METPSFDSNDIGRLSNGDGTNFNNTIRYRETMPGRFLQNYSIELSQDNEWNFGGTRQGGGLSVETSLTFPNFWTAEFESAVDFRSLDARLTRGGPQMGRPGGWSQEVTLRNRAAAQTA